MQKTLTTWIRIVYGGFFFLSFLVYRSEGLWLTAISSLLLVYLAFHSPSQWGQKRITYSQCLLAGFVGWIIVLIAEQAFAGA